MIVLGDGNLTPSTSPALETIDRIRADGWRVAGRDLRATPNIGRRHRHLVERRTRDNVWWSGVCRS
jgi:hypothetical protein